MHADAPCWHASADAPSESDHSVKRGQLLGHIFALQRMMSGGLRTMFACLIQSQPEYPNSAVLLSGGGQQGARRGAG